MIRRRSIGLSIVLVVATANVALAQEVKTVKLDGKALAQCECIQGKVSQAFRLGIGKFDQSHCP
jgi:hypothetical protein